MDDQKLSQDFELHEFGELDEFTDDDLEKLVSLCTNILQPIRDHYGKPLDINSGKRSKRDNAVAGGVTTSYHLFDLDHAAVDFLIPGTPTNEVFDWIRLESKLPFDKVIGEFQTPAKYAAKDWSEAIVHIQTQTTPRRLAYMGCTHGASSYQPAEVA